MSLRFTEINFIGNNQDVMKMLFLTFLVLLVDIVNFVKTDVFIDSAALLVNIAKGKRLPSHWSRAGLH